MFSNKLFIVLFLFFSLPIFSQNCEFKISGKISDVNTPLPISDVNISILKDSKGSVSDVHGEFIIDGLCYGRTKLQFSHLGYQDIILSINITKDTVLNLWMSPSDNLLDNVTITSKVQKNNSEFSTAINSKSITDNANQNLGNLLEQINGVRILRNGNGISKPVIHGLYGNRLMILNNGITQSGQQWGNDHSPEIDPLVANQITVIKGTSAVQYMGSSLGSVILIEPKKILREPNINGNSSLFFETNGLGSGINLQLQQYSSLLAWKINGTLKKSGDMKTPNYFLNNTGHQEANIAIQLEKKLFNSWYTDLYFSSFNTQLGVLRGSHIGNVTDLTEAFGRKIPFFTEPNFSYQIEAPKQKVNHQLLKLHSKYFLNDDQWLDFTIAGQLNVRKEFDVRRGSLIDIPSLNISQISFFSEAKFEANYKKDLKLISGLQFNFVDNTNQPETGILPLIPDYLTYQIGLFSLVSKVINKSTMDIGIRVDKSFQNVVKISNSFPREIIRIDQNFLNFNGSLGWSYQISPLFSLQSNIGFATRNPGINEFFSGGLHQGVSGIEEGNVNLKSEKSIKSTIGLKVNKNEIFNLESLVYFQNINDYIFLKPEDEIRLTIRGAFPVFSYHQTDARIYGLDIKSSIQLFQGFKVSFSYSYLKGEDISSDLPLINMPSNNLMSGINYQLQNPIILGKIRLNNTNFQINHSYVFRQQNLLPGQDYILPPDAYQLIGLKMSTEIPISRYNFRISTQVNNLFNIAYRDYLNRQRYFSDDLGRNISFVLNIQF